MSPEITTFRPRVAHPLHAVKDRRGSARIRTPVPVRLRSVGGGHGADVTSVVDNIGAGGFYVRVLRRLEPGARLAALIKFAADSGEAKRVARLAVRGCVLRVEELPGGVYGVAVKICQHKFV